MKVELSASGTPQQVFASLGKDIAREKKANPEAGHVLHAARDYLFALAKKQGTDPETGEETGASVTVSLTIAADATTAAVPFKVPVHADEFSKEVDAPFLKA